MVMASAVCTSSVLCWLSSASPGTKLAACPISCSATTVLSRSKAAKFHLSMWVTPLGPGHSYPYSGLKHLGISTKFKHRGYTEKHKRCRGKVIQASLFGIGAPEALVIGVVALLVFGPKGLAEVARNLGKTFREFQPTIRELQEVSREFKSSLEREIGIDDMSSTPGGTYRTNIPNATTTSSSTGVGDNSQTVADPNDVAPNPEKAYSTEDYLKVTQEQLNASLAKQLEQTSSLGGDRIATEINPQASEGTSAMPPVEKRQNDA